MKPIPFSSGNTNPPFSFFRKIAKSFKKPFPAHRKNNSPNELVITQEFVDQQLGTTTEDRDLDAPETTPPRETGAIPKIFPTTSLPTPVEQRQVERESYQYLSSLARNLQDFDRSTEKERQAFLRLADTALSEDNRTLPSRVSGPTFLEAFGNHRIIDVPQDELFELKHHLLINHRQVLPDDFLLETLRALVVTHPHITTPIQLFEYLELRTNYSPLISPAYELPRRNSSTAKDLEPPPYVEKTTTFFDSISEPRSTEQPNLPRSNVTVSPILNCAPPNETPTHSPPLQEPLTSTPGTNTLVIQTTAQIPVAPPPASPRRVQSISEPTPTGILPILKEKSTSKPNRKVSFSPTMSKDAISEQDIFDQTYAEELGRLVMSGLSLKLAVSSALTLARAAVQEISQGQASTQPVGVTSVATTPLSDPSQLGINTPIFSSTRQNGSMLTAPTSSQNVALTIPRTSPSPGMLLTQTTAPCHSNPSVQTANLPPSSTATHNELLCHTAMNTSPAPHSSYFLTPEEKAKKLKQSQAMQALIAVSIFCDRDTSGRFDDWVAHLESALNLGEFEESRKLQLMRTKLYGEAAEEFDTFKLDNPIRARNYNDVKSRLHKLFHSMETRSQRSVEFHNMSREPEENMRRYANRMRKAFHLAYPLNGKLDSSTSASREQMMMDRFIEGLQPDLQARLKHKDFPSLEKLIDKAELMAMAIEEAQTRHRIHAVYTARETSASSELARVVEALDRLNEKVDKRAATHHEEVERNLDLMRKQLAQKQIQFSAPNQSFVTQPGAFKRAAVFCDFHNTWGTHTESKCWVKQQMINDRCNSCQVFGHRSNFCPTIRNPKPPPLTGQPPHSNPSSLGPHPRSGGN